MGNLTLLLFIAMFAPLCMFLLVFKGESRRVVAFLIIGLMMCLLCGEINGLIYNLSGHDLYYLTVNIFPVVEEVCKALPILFFVFLYNPEKKDILMISLITGIGFSILENSFILAEEYMFANIALAIVRGFGAGMMHAMCCLMVGFGMTFVRDDKRTAFCGTFALLALAIMYHSVYNCLVQSTYPWLGIILPSLTFIPLLVVFKIKKSIKL